MVKREHLWETSGFIELWAKGSCSHIFNLSPFLSVSGKYGTETFWGQMGTWWTNYICQKADRVIYCHLMWGVTTVINKKDSDMRSVSGERTVWWPVLKVAFIDILAEQRCRAQLLLLWRGHTDWPPGVDDYELRAAETGDAGWCLSKASWFLSACLRSPCLGFAWQMSFSWL